MVIFTVVIFMFVIGRIVYAWVREAWVLSEQGSNHTNSGYFQSPFCVFESVMWTWNRDLTYEGCSGNMVSCWIMSVEKHTLISFAHHAIGPCMHFLRLPTLETKQCISTLLTEMMMSGGCYLIRNPLISHLIWQLENLQHSSLTPKFISSITTSKKP